MGRHLDRVDAVMVARKKSGNRGPTTYDQNDRNDQSRSLRSFPSFRSFSRSLSAPHKQDTTEQLHRVLDALDSRCPDHIEQDRWRQAVDDGGRFLATWGTQAHVLGWTVRDLFGLHQPPEKPYPSYRRLSRYDETGLIWLLEGREVVALTEETAAIRWAGGSITTYRKNNKPALGPLGQSPDELR
jgi:hypothetical protein